MPETETLQAIFRYHDGQRTRAVDPMVVMRKLRRLKDQGIDLVFCEAALRESDDESLCEESWQSIIAAARQVFEIEPLSDAGGKVTGLTEDATYEVFDSFGQFIDSLKKSTSLRQTSPPSSDQEDCRVSVPSASTSDSSDSG